MPTATGPDRSGTIVYFHTTSRKPSLITKMDGNTISSPGTVLHQD